MKADDSARLFRERYRVQLAGPGAKYQRLRRMFDAALDDGFWGEDGRIPTEHEIARATGLSLGTIQRTLRELVAEGRLVRTPRRGTFVTRGPYPLDEPFVNARFLDDGGTAPLPMSALLVSRGVTSRHGTWTEALKPSNGSLFRVERRFDVNGEFQLLHHFYVDAARFPKFGRLGVRDLRSGDLRALLAKMHDLPAVTHHQTLRFQRFSAEVARALRCRPGTTGLLQSVTATIGDRDAVYFIQLFIPPNPRALQLPDAVLRR